MPTYNYKCPNGHTLEIFEPMTAFPTRLCPECPQPDDVGDNVNAVYMHRVIGAGGGVIWKQGAPTPKFGRRR